MGKPKSDNNTLYSADFVHITKAENSFGRNKLDTLGQLGTGENIKRTIELSGIGSDITDKKKLKAKAKKKFITHKVVLPLIDYAREKGNKSMVSSLWNSYRCLNKVIISNQRMHGKYCKNRICTICNGIRKAEMINQYLIEVQTWEDPYFVTLTAKSCPAYKLYERIRNTKRALKRIEDRIKKRHQRGNGPKLVIIKSLECNFNPAKRWYNPHFHILVPNKELADILITEWLSLWTEKFTSRVGQNMRKVEDTERDLIEVIKYSSKILTEPDPRQKAKKNKITVRVYIAALYNILNAMKGLRLVDTCGFKVSKERSKSVSLQKIIDYQELSYQSEIMDWVDEETGETLSDYSPAPELMNILNHKIDTNLE